MKVKELEQHATPKEFEQQQELEQQPYQNEVANYKPINFSTFPIYNLLELTCFVRNYYCLMSLSTRRNLQAFQVGRENVKCKQCFDQMRHFCGAKKLGPDCTFIHCLRVDLLLVSPVAVS